MHKYDPKYPQTCPSCHHEKEDTAHFWKCQAPSRLVWRREFLKELRKKLVDIGTGCEVRELLISKLRAVLDGEDPNRVPDDPTLTVICDAQKMITWEQLMIGRFARAWGMHTSTQPGKTQRTSKSWTTEVIDFIFTQWWKLWTLRNQDRHGRDLATQATGHSKTSRQRVTHVL